MYLLLGTRLVAGVLVHGLLHRLCLGRGFALALLGGALHLLVVVGMSRHVDGVYVEVVRVRYVFGAACD
jgi:hypothetical protein